MSDKLVPFGVRVRVQQQDPIDIACRDIEMAAADFMVAILAATTVDECFRLRRRIEAAAAMVDALASSALERADRISREKD